MVTIRTFVICMILSLGAGVGSGTGAAVYLTGNVVEDQHHTDCLHANESRAGIIGAQKLLVDAFVSNSSPASQERIRQLGATYLAQLKKALPQRNC